MAKYGPKAKEKVEKAMRERKKGTLKSGRSGKKVTSRKQAIAIGLSEARRSGVRLPPPKGKTKQTRRKAARDTAIGKGRKVSPTRSRGAKQAARTRERRYRRSERK